MKPIAVVLIALAAGSAPVVASHLIGAPEAAEGARTEPLESPRLALLEEQLERMDARSAKLEESLEGLRAELAGAVPEAAPRIPVGAIDAAVERALAEREGMRTLAAEQESAKPSAPKLTVDDIYQALRAGDFENDFDREQYWQKVRDAGLMDAVIERFEQHASAFPNDPTAQVELGEVYLQKIMEVGNGPLAGLWATKADGAFEAALALDDQHWDARFNKAAALSFWPPVFGKQSEAIQQFEILTEQQELAQAQPRHAQTYILLGNLYQQNGKPEKAIEAWERGLERFPDNTELIGQLEIADE